MLYSKGTAGAAAKLSDAQYGPVWLVATFDVHFAGKFAASNAFRHRVRPTFARKLADSWQSFMEKEIETGSTEGRRRRR